MAEIGFGATLSVNDGSSNAQQAFLEVVTITPPSPKVSAQKTSNLSTPSKTDTFLPGFIDPGEASFEANYNKADFLRLVALVGASKTWIASSPDGTPMAHTFTGFVSDGPEVTYEGDTVVKTKWKVKVSGAVTVA